MSFSNRVYACLNIQNTVLPNHYQIKLYILKPVSAQGARHIFSGAVGKNIANPTAMLLCSANLLAHVNLHPYSRQIKNAINKYVLIS